MDKVMRSGGELGNLARNRCSSGCLIVKKKKDYSGSKMIEKKRPRLILSSSESSEELPSDRFHCNSSYSKVENEIHQTKNFEVHDSKRYRLIEEAHKDGPGFLHSEMRRAGLERLEQCPSKHAAVKKKPCFPNSSSPFSTERDREAGYCKSSQFERKRERYYPLEPLWRENHKDPSDEHIRVQGKSGVLKVMVNSRSKFIRPRAISGTHIVEKRNPSLLLSPSDKHFDRKDSIQKPGGKSSQLNKAKVNVNHIDDKVELRPGTDAESSGSIRQLEVKGTQLHEQVNGQLEAKGTQSGTEKRELHVQVKGELEEKGAQTGTEKQRLHEQVKGLLEEKGARTGAKKQHFPEQVKGQLEEKRGRTGTEKKCLREQVNGLLEEKGAQSNTGNQQLRKQVKGQSEEMVAQTGTEKKQLHEHIKGQLEDKGARTGTEKQQLREQIKDMLISAGWKIEYRPRRNRDYLDAVYINPGGTAYWSIIKAYDAFIKHKDGMEASFNPIPEEVICKLTRQTKKKMERDMKKQGDKHVKENSNLPSKAPKENSSKKKLACLVKQSNSMGEDPAVTMTRSKKTGRSTLIVRNADKGENPEFNDEFARNQGKKTLLSWMIDSGSVCPSEKVQYINRKYSRVMLEGWITRDGIHCGCCSKILTVSKFEIHAGSKLRQPFQNIFLKSGRSLLDCQLDAWNMQNELERSGFHTVYVDSDDPNDDTCAICGDGGDLICCDGCPSTFHQSCLNIKMLPPGDWHCPNCSCKFCGSSEEGSVPGSNGTAARLISCMLCQRKYHDSCIIEEGVPSLGSRVFCGKKCMEIYEHLQKSLGVKHELEGGFSWSLLRRTDPEAEESIKGFPQIIECNSKLAVALSVIDECFLPIIDRRSGIHLIHNVVYNCGSNFSRLDYSGFYTAVLERGDEMISAASIRFHGTQLAEMPFIGTRHIYRRQGMCRRLFRAIESALASLEVEKLVIPAIPDLIDTWTGVFDFRRLEESHRMEMKSLNMLVFPDIDMLQKPLHKLCPQNAPWTGKSNSSS